MLRIDAHPGKEILSKMSMAYRSVSVKYLCMSEDFCIPGTFEDQYGKAGDYIVQSEDGYNLFMMTKESFEKTYKTLSKVGPPISNIEELEVAIKNNVSYNSLCMSSTVSHQAPDATLPGTARDKVVAVTLACSVHNHGDLVPFSNLTNTIEPGRVGEYAASINRNRNIYIQG